MKINSTTGTGNFKIESDEKEYLELKYKNWFSSVAKTQFDNKEIEIKPKNFWNTSFDIYHNEKNVGDIKFNWMSNAMITIGEEVFLLKTIGMWDLKFELINKNKDRVFLIKPDLKWKKIKYDYEIELTSEDYELNKLIELLIYVGFSTNLYMTATMQQ